MRCLLDPDPELDPDAAGTKLAANFGGVVEEEGAAEADEDLLLLLLRFDDIVADVRCRSCCVS